MLRGHPCGHGLWVDRVPPAAHWSSDLLRPSAPRPKLTSEAPSAGGALGRALLTAAEASAAPGRDWTQGGCVCRSQGCGHLQVQGEWRPDGAGGGETPRPRSGHTCTHAHSCTHSHTRAHARTHMHTHSHVHMHTHTDTRGMEAGQRGRTGDSQTEISTHTRTHTHMRAHACACVHAQTPRHKGRQLGRKPQTVKQSMRQEEGAALSWEWGRGLPCSAPPSTPGMGWGRRPP